MHVDWMNIADYNNMSIEYAKLAIFSVYSCFVYFVLSAIHKTLRVN